MKKKLIILFAIFNPVIMFSMGNPCDTFAARLKSTYEIYKPEFRNQSWKKLRESISEDEILRDKFFSNDSSRFKKLELFIAPILKFSEEAENYKDGDDICKYLRLDTIDFHCGASFYEGDSLAFFITRGTNDCDIGFRGGARLLVPGEPVPPPCPDDYTFTQGIYNASSSPLYDYKCRTPQFRPIKDTTFRFWLEGFSREFKLINYRIYMTTNEYVTDTDLEWTDNCMQYFNYLGIQDRIRHIARKCPAGGFKWWYFWDWDIFH